MSKFTLTAEDLEDIAPTLSAALPHPLNILFDDVADTLGGGDQEVYATVGFGIGISKTLAGDWEISGKYVVTRIAGRYDSESDRLSNRSKCLSHIDFKIPAEPTAAEPTAISVVSEQAATDIEDLEGHTVGGGWRVIRALEPVKGSPHGGFILEHRDQF